MFRGMPDRRRTLEAGDLSPTARAVAISRGRLLDDPVHAAVFGG
jgi:hypothetical protein